MHFSSQERRVVPDESSYLWIKISTLILYNIGYFISKCQQMKDVKSWLEIWFWVSKNVPSASPLSTISSPSKIWWCHVSSCSSVDHLARILLQIPTKITLHRHPQISGRRKCGWCGKYMSQTGFNLNLYSARSGTLNKLFWGLLLLTFLYIREKTSHYLLSLLWKLNEI